MSGARCACCLTSSIQSTNSNHSSMTNMDAPDEDFDYLVQENGLSDQDILKSPGFKDENEQSLPLVIDLHTHIIPETWPDMKKQFPDTPVAWMTLERLTEEHARMMLGGQFFRDIDSRCWSIEQRLLDCQHYKVDVQVLSTVPAVGFNYEAPADQAIILARYLNDHIASIIHSHPSRFMGLATIPLQDMSIALEELERALETGHSGVQIGTRIGQKELDDASLFPFWQYCAHHDIPVFIHPWGMETGGRMQEYWFPWLVGMPTETTMAITRLLMSGTLHALPELRLCLAHGGGSFPFTLGRLHHGQQARPDLCQKYCRIPLKEQVQKHQGIFVDSLVHDRQVLQLLVQVLGKDRVVLGSDYPFPLGEARPGKLIRKTWTISQEEDLSKELRQKQRLHEYLRARVLASNALQFLGKNRTRAWRTAYQQALEKNQIV